MIITVGSKKGGCGKSTIATNISVFLAKKGEDVLLMDADVQSTSSNWAMDRFDAKIKPDVQCIQKFGNIRNTLLDLEKRYQTIIVDTGGHDSRELRTAMTAADVLIIPFKPSQPDLDTLPKMNSLVIQAKDLNPRLHVYAVLTMASTNPTVKEDIESREFFDDFSNIELINYSVRDRKVYRDAISLGQGVIETSNIKAKEEITNLIKGFYNAG